MASLRCNSVRHGGSTAWLAPWALALGLVASGLSPVSAQISGPELTAPDKPRATPASPRQQTAGGEKKATVVDVRIAGNKSLPLDRILPHIRTRPGREFDLELIQEDVRRLDKTRMFVSVKTFMRPVPGGLVVVFDIIERPLLKEVLFVGCQEIRKKTLQKEANIKAGDPMDPFANEEARHKLEEYYHKQGFNLARVTLLEGDKPEDRRAIFLVNEGHKQKVFSTKFIGNTIADDGRLQTVIKSKHPFLYLFGGELDRNQLDEDLKRLTAYYRGLGFFKARIGREMEFNEKGDWVTITFVIDEGPRYKIRNISVVGNKHYQNDELLTDLKLNRDDYFNQAKLTNDLNAIQDKYGSVGYVFADIKADPRFLEEPGQLDLVYNIKEGDRYRFGKIDVQIKGEYPHTQLTTVLNRLSIKPGDIVDTRKIRASEATLKRSGLFENNPATGNPPKIVYHPPGQEDEEADNKPETASRPRGGRKPGERVRGQSPDEPSPDRVLDLTLVGDYVAPREEASHPAQRYQPQPGEVRAIYEQPRQQPGPNKDDLLISKARSFSNLLSTGAEQPRPREGLIQTQYSPDGGQSNPTNRTPLQWSGTQNTSSSQLKRPVAGSYSNNGYQNNSYSNSGYSGGSYTSSPEPSAGSTAGQSYSPATDPFGGPATSSPPPSSQPAPAQPAPQYGQRWPEQGTTERAVNTPEGSYMPGPVFSPSSPFVDGPPDSTPFRTLPPTTVTAEEAMTGRLMFGVGINSDAGLVGSVVLDEQNFDWTRLPRSWEDFRNGTAFRGAGQRFRIEAVPGTQVQRYMVNWTDPYMFNTQVSLGLSGYYYNRIYTEYDEQRLGGRVAMGYQFTPDLSASIAYRGAKINITDPIDPLLPDLAEVTGRDLALHGFQLSFAHDKRDNAFLATEGHLLEVSMEEVLGSFQYPHAEVDLRKYFTLFERPDGSGRHVLSLAGRVGYTGDDTPIYERYYAGGFSTIRGFRFRGASPMEIGPSTGQDIAVGGNFMLLASAEYMFPITADDMLRGVVFCDTGTVEPTIDNWSNKYRVAPGFGLRIAVPAMGPAPIALDFAFPVSWQPGDKQEMFSFFVGFGR